MIKKTVGLPFTFVPTEIEVTVQHIIITYRQLLGTSQQEMIPIKDVHAVAVNCGIFFGLISVAHSAPEKKTTIHRFHKRDAQELEMEIQKILDSMVKE